MNSTALATNQRLSAREIEDLDPYLFMGLLGKRVIHPGGRNATEELFERAAFQPDHQVLDVGCGVGTTAIDIASRFGARVTAVDIAPIMLERARTNVREAQLDERVSVDVGDITALAFATDSFDRVVAEAVTMFVDRPQAASEMVRVCRPGGQVLAIEFFWRQPPTPEARDLFLGEVCPGMTFDALEEWIAIYRDAGLEAIKTSTGPFEMMTPRGFIEDEGMLNSTKIMGRALSRWSSIRKMAWLMPRINRVVPYLGYLVISGVKPA
ncbi:hypothetical protein BH23CHL2_BH23CHL2_31290 [soil metagenome]